MECQELSYESVEIQDSFETEYPLEKTIDNGDTVELNSYIDRNELNDDSVSNDQNVNIASQDLKTLWPQFLDMMLKDRPNLGSFLSLAYVASCTENSITLGFQPSYSFQFMEVSKKHNKDDIEKTLSQFTSKKIEISIILEDKITSAEEKQFFNQAVQIPSTIDVEIEKEPIIRTILEIFDGEVLN